MTSLYNCPVALHAMDLSRKQYPSLYNINEIIFLSFYLMNTVTKQRDPDTGQHSLLFQVRGLYWSTLYLFSKYHILIVFIQSEQLITLKKSVINLGAVLLSILLFFFMILIQQQIATLNSGKDGGFAFVTGVVFHVFQLTKASTKWARSARHTRLPGTSHSLCTCPCKKKQEKTVHVMQANGGVGAVTKIKYLVPHPSRQL